MSENVEQAVAPISLILTDPMIFPLVPQDRRDAAKLLWKLNNRLAEMAVSGKEPALRQIRLRWWADQLAMLDNGTTPHEPLLAELVGGLLPVTGAGPLARLAEAWMDAAADEEAGSEPGAQLFALTAQLLGADRHPAEAAKAGRLWSGVSAALRQDATGAPAWARLACEAGEVRIGRLPRPLAALTALSAAVARRHGERRWRREQLLVLRVGLFGR